MNIPDTITQGEKKTWKDSNLVDDLNNPLSAPTWTLYYAVRGPNAVNGVYGVNLVSTADGTGFSTTLNANDSANLLGYYNWVAYLQQGSDTTTRINVGKGDLYVLPDITLIDPTTQGFDGRSDNEKRFADIETAMTKVGQALAAGDNVVEYTIGGRHTRRQPTSELFTALQSQHMYLKRLVVKERQQDIINNGGGDPRHVTFRFVSPR